MKLFHMGQILVGTGAYHVQSDFKKGSTYPISVEIISINSKPVESPIKVLFDFRTA